MLVIEHDLTLLDYMSDKIHLMYGVAGAYGIVSTALPSAQAVNAYFEGFHPVDNTRFRPDPLTLSALVRPEGDAPGDGWIDYGCAVHVRGSFSVAVDAGRIPASSAVVLLLGENGTGKSTTVHAMAQDDPSVSCKPQTVTPGDYPDIPVESIVGALPMYTQAVWHTEVLKPLALDALSQRKPSQLSGGELQRLALAVALGRSAMTYLLDEPSSHLDVEQRARTARIVKRFALVFKKRVFVVEHDVMMASAMGAEYGSRVIRFERDGAGAHAHTAVPYAEGMDAFLRTLELTFRLENAGARTVRPRLNKPGSQRDRDQKRDGTYYV